MKQACDCSIAAIKERGFFRIVISRWETGPGGPGVCRPIYYTFITTSQGVQVERGASKNSDVSTLCKTCLQAAE